MSEATDKLKKDTVSDDVDNTKKQVADRKDQTSTEDIVSRAVDKITNALLEKNNVTAPATDGDREYVRTKILTDGNLKEIEYPSDVKSLSKDEKIVFFFKSLLYADKDPASGRVLRALVEGTAADGGYLVPEELKNEIWRVLPDYSVMRKIARVIPMQTNSLKLNSLAARPYAYWTSEYASKSTTSAEFGQVELTPTDLVCLLPVTEQLLADANINLVNFIVQLFTEAIATEEDAKFFTGTGTNQPKGIDAETLTQVNAGLAGTFDHIITLLHSVPQRARMSRSAAFVANGYTMMQLRKLKDGNNNYIWESGNPNKGEADRLYGYPIYEQNAIGNGHIFFGDWSYYVIGDRQQVRVATTTEGGEAWRRNAVEIKAVSRVDGAAVLTTPFAEIINF